MNAPSNGVFDARMFWERRDGPCSQAVWRIGAAEKDTSKPRTAPFTTSSQFGLRYLTIRRAVCHNLIICIILLPKMCFSITYTIDGFVDYTYRNGTNQFQYGTLFVPFRLTLDQGRWLLHTKPPNAKIQKLEVAFDGTNTYLLAYDAPSKGMGVTRKCDVPNFVGEPRAASIWAAYGSSYFFLTNRAEFITPPATLGVVSGGSYDYSRPIKFRFIADFSNQNLDVPSRLICLDERGWNFETGKPYPLPFNTMRFTNVVFEVISTTNVDGKTFPSVSKATVFGLGWFCGEPTNLVTLSTMTIVATNFQRDSAVTTLFQPQFEGEITMVDQRFYESSNKLESHYEAKRWLSDREVISNKAFIAGMLKQSETQSSIKRIIVFGVLFLSSLIFAFTLRKQVRVGQAKG